MSGIWKKIRSISKFWLLITLLPLLPIFLYIFSYFLHENNYEYLNSSWEILLFYNITLASANLFSSAGKPGCDNTKEKMAIPFSLFLITFCAYFMFFFNKITGFIRINSTELLVIGVLFSIFIFAVLAISNKQYVEIEEKKIRNAQKKQQDELKSKSKKIKNAEIEGKVVKIGE